MQDEAKASDSFNIMVIPTLSSSKKKDKKAKKASKASKAIYTPVQSLLLEPLKKKGLRKRKRTKKEAEKEHVPKRRKQLSIETIKDSDKSEEEAEAPTITQRYLPKTQKMYKFSTTKLLIVSKGKRSISGKTKRVKQALALDEEAVTKEEEEASIKDKAKYKQWYVKIKEYSIIVISPKLESDNAAVTTYFSLYNTAQL